MTAVEVAALLRVGKSWVYNEAHAGRLPSGHFGKSVRFRRTDVERYIQAKFPPVAAPVASQLECEPAPVADADHDDNGTS